MDEGFTFYNNGDARVITPALLEAIFDTIPVGIEMLKAIRDEKNKIIDFEYLVENDTLRKNPGYVNKVGKKFLTENGSCLELFKKMAEVAETGQPSHCIFSGHPPGNTLWFELSYLKSGDAIIAFRENITNKKFSEQRIREDAHFIDQIVHTSPDVIYIMDLNTLQVVYTNRQIAEQLGYTKQQIDWMKNPIMDIMWKPDIPSFKEHLQKIKTLSSDNKVLEIEYRLVDAKGNVKWFCDRNTVFKRDSRKAPVEKLGFSQDITARKEQEEQLLTGLDILDQAENISGMGSWEYDIYTGNFKWSEGMYNLFNLPKEVRPEPEIYYDYTPVEERPVIAKIVARIKDEYEAFDEIVTLLPPNSEKKIIRIRAIPLKDKKNNVVKMAGVDLDISPQVKANEEINELNKALVINNRQLEDLNGELKTFNTVTSRDFKETLQLLYTNLEYIARYESRNLGDSSKANLRRAQSAIQKMKLLTDDINTYLQLYDIGIDPSLIDPNPIIEQILFGMQENIRESNALIERAEMPRLFADPYLFSRLLIQLLENSLKFRKLIIQPVIKIRYSQADEMNAVPLALKNMSYAIISVSDNGIGFSDAESAKIFELFYRIPAKNKYKGSGIGLAICKKIMAMHQGFITAEGSPAGGATFNCYFPLHKTEKR